MNNWVLADEKTPNNGQKVLVMLKDATGYNVIYKDGWFVLERDEAKRWRSEDVKFWKPRDGFEDYQHQVKKCGMCGYHR